MPTMGLMEGILLAGVVVAAGGTAATTAISASGADKQDRIAKKKFAAEQEARRVAQKRDKIDAARARMAQLREKRRIEGQIINESTNAGLGGSTSGVMGAVSSLSTTTGREQGNTNLRGGFADELSRLSSLSAQYANKYDKIGRNTKNLQSIFQGVTSIAGAAVSAGGGMKQFGANIKSGAYSWS